MEPWDGKHVDSVFGGTVFTDEQKEALKPWPQIALVAYVGKIFSYLGLVPCILFLPQLDGRIVAAWFIVASLTPRIASELCIVKAVRLFGFADKKPFGIGFFVYTGLVIFLARFFSGIGGHIPAH